MAFQPALICTFCSVCKSSNCHTSAGWIALIYVIAWVAYIIHFVWALRLAQIPVRAVGLRLGSSLAICYLGWVSDHPDDLIRQILSKRGRGHNQSFSCCVFLST